MDDFKISFNIDVSLAPALLREFLSGGFTGRISHVYIDWPFNILSDSSSQIKEKTEMLRPLSAVLNQSGISGVMTFDYTCFGDHHLTLKFQKKLRDIVQFCRDAGISAFSLSDLYLSQLFFCSIPPYDNFSGAGVYLSHKARINRPIKLNYLDNLPFSMVTLHHDAVCDLNEDGFIPEKTGYNLEIPLNTRCMARCPFEIVCRAGEFHIEQEEPEKDFMPEKTGYYRERCIMLSEKLSPSPAFNLIRPNELKDWLDKGYRFFRYFSNGPREGDFKNIECYLKQQNPEDELCMDIKRRGCRGYERAIR